MSNDNSASIVSKVWNYAHVLKNAGVGYGDYVEQITYLLFLKLADEMTELGFDNPIPAEFQWSELSSRSGDDLEVHYRHTLENLGKQPGLVGIIFRKAQNKIANPSDLARVIKMIADEDWSGMDVDIKGAIYEGLLEKTASSSDKGAGQYFTPRPLIRAIVEVMQPQPGQLIGDPACGTGGFLLAAHDHIQAHHQLDKAARKHLKTQALHGNDIVPAVVSLCAMNLYLHGIGSTRNGEAPITEGDALAKPSGRKFDMILANPPFGKKGGYTIVGDDGRISTEKQEYERDEFWATTSNKQLNFLQHIVSELAIGGSAAVVLPDNVLFEGGAGETIRRNLLKRCKVHTLLRLPTGIFYAQGVKANVLFFEKKGASEDPWTKDLWIYDLRTNQHFTLKTNPLKESDLDDFVACYFGRDARPARSAGELGVKGTTADDRAGRPYLASRSETERFKKFTYDEIVARDKANLDIFWLKDESLEDTENLPPPAELAAEIVESLEAALEEFRAVEEALASSEE